MAHQACGTKACTTIKACTVTAVIALALIFVSPVNAQKAGGILKVYFFDSPASMSIHEEATFAGQGPMMGFSTTSSCMTRACRRAA